MSDLLEVRHASKSYAGIPALVDTTFDLRAGEVHALIGENGAGKSTLIKIIAGVIMPDTVEIAVRGKPAIITNPRMAFDLGLRFIHQELNVVPQLSVAENIFLGQPYPTRWGIKVNWRRLNLEAQQVLTHLEIIHLSPRMAMARLSPGDQMLVNIAHAFVGGERAGDTGLIYVMDEPTAALTGQEIKQFFALIQRLKAQGSAVLYVSHRMDELFEIADRVTVMRDGRVIGTHGIASVTPADLIFMMTGREVKQVYPPRSDVLGGEVLLEARDLKTRFVRDISFQLRAGEIVGVSGLSGSGRTELLRALMGVDRVLAGEFLLRGHALRQHNPARAWQQGLAFVPEERRSQALILSRSVSNNITLPQLSILSRRGMLLANKLERRTSEELAALVRLKTTGMEQTVRELSGGNQQKVVFARALARPPRVLLLDEPTRGVDVGAKTDIYALIREISARGTGIIIASSDLPELLGMTDRILVMRAGQLVETIPTAGLTQEGLLARCYGEIKHGGSR
ncbi:MAG: sugar ABC transporter ATP-binding protein [Anaerolineae bacterium]